MTPLETLQTIRDRLADTPPVQIIEALLPCTRSDALTWARRLPGWDEHRGQFPAQVIGLARTISRRSMREHRLMIDEDGRVVDLTHGRYQRPTPTTFRLTINGEELLVQHTRDYFPGKDNVYFLSPKEPGQAHCLSNSGYLSQFVPHDAVEACGGPQAFARMFAEARLAGTEQAFMAEFEGKWPEVKGRRQKPAVEPEITESVEQPKEAVQEPFEPPQEPPTATEPSDDQHAAKVVERRRKPGQGLLF